MLPKTDHLFWLRHDEDAFERERNRLISDYIKSLPEERRAAAYLMQLRIDEARLRLSQEELLMWMQREAVELAANLGDQFSYLGHRAQDLKQQLDASESAG